MELQDIKITKENFSKYNNTPYNNLYGIEAKEAMEWNMSLNEYLDKALEGRNDWGGDYASWLNSFGINHQTEEGWWSKAAIDHDNIKAFIADMTDETGEISDAFADIRSKVTFLKSIGYSVVTRKKVIDLCPTISLPS